MPNRGARHRMCPFRSGARRRLGRPGGARAAVAAGARLHALPGRAQDFAQDGDDLVELGPLGDEGRRDLDDGVPAVVRAADEARLEKARREEAPQERLALLVRERLAGLLVLHELEGVEEPGPAQIADDGEVQEPGERLAERVLLRGDVLDDALPLHDLDVLERDRRLDRMTAEGDPMRVHGGVLEERLHHRVARDERADRRVGRREPLRARDQVRADVVALGCEPSAEPAEGGDDLVRAEEDPVAVADLAHATPVALRRREGAAGVLHGLHDHHRHRLRPSLLDRLVELLEQERGELGLRLPRRPVEAVGVPHVHDVRDKRLERGPQRGDAVDGERAHRRPVVRDPARDHLPTALAPRGVVLAGELPRRLDRLRPSRAEEDPVQVPGCQRRDLGGELDRARVGVAPVRVEGELAHLRRRRVPHLLAEPVADVDGEEARERVQVALALRVLEVAAVSPHDDGDLAVGVARHAGEVEPEVVAGGLLEVEGGRTGGGTAHAAPFRRRCWKRTLASIRPTATTKMIVPSTFTCGGAPTRAAPQTNIGNVTVEPALKFVMMKSSMERANASSAPARIPGAIRGSVTRANVVQGVAPRSIAASSRCRSKPTSRARTVTTTKLMLNMTCAKRIVQKPRATPRLRKSVKSEAPRTIYGAVIAMKTSVFVAPRPR